MAALPSRVRRSRLAALLLLAPLCLHAQFNGPADTAKDTVNAPHVITTDPAILYPKAHDTPLRAGDQIRFSITGSPEVTVTARISEEGFYPVPLIDPVQIGDLSPREASRLIAGRLEDAKMYVHPHVELDVVESPKSAITVMGESRGSVAGLAGSRRLFDVLSTTGGLNANTSHVIVIDRPGLTDTINVDLGTDPERSRFANVPVYPGDTIITSRIGSYYLLGAFKQQGAFPLSNTAPFTMLQMLAAGGGRFYEGKLKEVQLIRTVGTTRSVTVVNLDAVMKGRAPDPVLQADDIVYLPSEKYKAAIRSGGFSTALGIVLTLYAIIRD